MTVGQTSLAILQNSVKAHPRLLLHRTQRGTCSWASLPAPATVTKNSFTSNGLAAVLFYLMAYGLMNLGCFAVARRARTAGPGPRRRAPARLKPSPTCAALLLHPSCPGLDHDPLRPESPRFSAPSWASLASSPLFTARDFGPGIPARHCAGRQLGLSPPSTTSAIAFRAVPGACRSQRRNLRCSARSVRARWRP